MTKITRPNLAVERNAACNVLVTSVVGRRLDVSSRDACFVFKSLTDVWQVTDYLGKNAQHASTRISIAHMLEAP